MNGERIAGALGLVRRAGKITVGSYSVSEAIRKKKASVVLFASDAGQSAEQKIAFLANRDAIPVKRIPLTKKELAHCLGKSGEAVCVSVPFEFLNLVLASL